MKSQFTHNSPLFRRFPFNSYQIKLTKKKPKTLKKNKLLFKKVRYKFNKINLFFIQKNHNQEKYFNNRKKDKITRNNRKYTLKSK